MAVQNNPTVFDDITGVRLPKGAQPNTGAPLAVFTFRNPDGTFTTKEVRDVGKSGEHVLRAVISSFGVPDGDVQPDLTVRLRRADGSVQDLPVYATSRGSLRTIARARVKLYPEKKAKGANGTGTGRGRKKKAAAADPTQPAAAPAAA